MFLNQHTALVTPRILLVPYSEHHVLRYHEWMQDEDLQALTASEPLSLEEEYSMQQSWRRDNDKLTFIACLPPTTNNQSSKPNSLTINSKTDDAPARMIGDINLFLTPADDDENDYEGEVNDEEADLALSNDQSTTLTTTEETSAIGQTAALVIGEIELMIAEKSLHRQGYGRAALLAFLGYITANLPLILAEYSSTSASAPTMTATENTTVSSLKYLRVKINQDNQGSIKLFESVGFVQTAEGPNYFGEVELRLPRGDAGGVIDELRRCKGWQEVSVARYV